jgi:hypothetical protein
MRPCVWFQRGCDEIESDLKSVKRVCVCGVSMCVCVFVCLLVYASMCVVSARLR